MSANSPDDGWQIATGRKRKPNPNPAAEAEASVSRPGLSAAQPSAVEPAASSPHPAEPVTSTATNEPVQQTTTPPVIVSAAEESQSSYLTVPEKSSPSKSERSNLSSSLERGYLTARQSPQEGSVSSDVPGNGGSSEGEEGYVSATEHFEDVSSDVDHPQASSEEAHLCFPSSSDNDDQSRGRETDVHDQGNEAATTEVASDTAGTSPDLQKPHTQYLSFPVPEFEDKGKEKAPEEDTSSTTRAQFATQGETATLHEALSTQSALSPEDQLKNKEREKVWWVERNAQGTPEEKAESTATPSAADTQIHQSQTVSRNPSEEKACTRTHVTRAQVASRDRLRPLTRSRRRRRKKLKSSDQSARQTTTPYENHAASRCTIDRNWC